jgi:preprotein translocase subunit SecA
MTLVSNDLHTVFDARRVKSPELQGLDFTVNGWVGAVRNRIPVLKKLQKIAAEVGALEEEVKNLGSQRFRETVYELQAIGRKHRLTEKDNRAAWLKAWAVAREAAWRSLGKRPYDVQIMGAIAITWGTFAEMATGEGKTLTASLAASVWAWGGRPVHVITVNDYLVERDAELMRPVYEIMGTTVGAIIHDLEAHARPEVYRRGVVYTTSKELVADFLRDQIALGQLKTGTQTRVATLLRAEWQSRPLMIPGLFRCIVDEADSLLIDEGVTPLIISNEPDGNPNEELYRAAHELAEQLQEGTHFRVDKTVKSVEMTARGQEKLEEITTQDARTFWKGRRRREELVTQALTALHCFHRDEQYLVESEEDYANAEREIKGSRIQIIDEYTGRVMADRSWRHGLHQAIEIKEGVEVTADKENLAHMSFQRFFRQYPELGGMTGTAWEANYELWQIYQRRVVRIPPNKPCIRTMLPTLMYDTMEEKWANVIRRVAEVHATGAPVLLGTRSVAASEILSKLLTEAGLEHDTLNAAQNKTEAEIISGAGTLKRITVATNMAGRGTDIHTSSEVNKLGGLHVISTEPNTSYRIDRQLYGRAARQGNPGTAQLICCAEDDLFIRQVNPLRRFWRIIGPDRLIAIAQANAEKLATFNRRQVLKNDDWMDQAVPF